MNIFINSRIKQITIIISSIVRFNEHFYEFLKPLFFFLHFIRLYLFKDIFASIFLYISILTICIKQKRNHDNIVFVNKDKFPKILSTVSLLIFLFVRNILFLWKWARDIGHDVFLIFLLIT